jgi:hypothetical protein
MHLFPDSVQVKAVETPHYINTLLKEKPLIKEGMLTVTAPTKGRPPGMAVPLVMANLLTTTTAGVSPDVISKEGDGFVSGTASGAPFAFNTKPGSLYRVADMETDALAMTWSPGRVFAAMATIFRRQGLLVVGSDAPVTFELSGDSLRYDLTASGKLKIGVAVRPVSILLNGVPVAGFAYDSQREIVTLEAPEGEGVIVIKNEL